MLQKLSSLTPWLTPCLNTSSNVLNDDPHVEKVYVPATVTTNVNDLSAPPPKPVMVQSLPAPTVEPVIVCPHTIVASAVAERDGADEDEGATEDDRDAATDDDAEGATEDEGDAATDGEAEGQVTLRLNTPVTPP